MSQLSCNINLVTNKPTMETDKNILFGGPEIPDITFGNKSLGEYCLKKLLSLGDKPVLIDIINNNETITAAELVWRSVRTAQCLQNAGVKPGDCIGICSENRLEFAYILFGAIFTGATVAPYNYLYTERELVHILNVSQPRFIFVSDITRDKVVSASTNLEFIKRIYVFGDEFLGRQKYQSYNVFIRNSKIPSLNHPNEFQCLPVNVRDTVAIILCSSGTTGLAKGVELTQWNVFAILAQTLYDGVAPVLLTIGPWSHLYGIFSLLKCVIFGNLNVMMSRFDDRLFFECIQKYKIKFLALVPPLMVFLAKTPLVNEYDLSSVERIISTAAPLSAETINAVKKRTGIKTVYQTYGMTEIGGVLVQNEQYCKSGSVGHIRAGVYGKIIDPVTGQSLGPNQSGEMCFKANCIMRGYCRNPEATKTTFDSDGWMHTGDAGYYDEDGEWFVVDRLKELIKYKGNQVPPAELEALLITHPSVQDAGVIGIPDESVGEKPMAFVVRNDEISEKEIIDFVAKNSSPAKRLHGGVRFINEIPKNPSGKIIRRILKELSQKHTSKL